MSVKASCGSAYALTALFASLSFWLRRRFTGFFFRTVVSFGIYFIYIFYLLYLNFAVIMEKTLIKLM